MMWKNAVSLVLFVLIFTTVVWGCASWLTGTTPEDRAFITDQFVGRTIANAHDPAARAAQWSKLATALELGAGEVSPEAAKLVAGKWFDYDGASVDDRKAFDWVMGKTTDWAPPDDPAGWRAAWRELAGNVRAALKDRGYGVEGAAIGGEKGLEAASGATSGAGKAGTG